MKRVTPRGFGDSLNREKDDSGSVIPSRVNLRIAHDNRVCESNRPRLRYGLPLRAGRNKENEIRDCCREIQTSRHADTVLPLILVLAKRRLVTRSTTLGFA